MCAFIWIKQYLRNRDFFDTSRYADKLRSLDRYRRLRTRGRCQETLQLDVSLCAILLILRLAPFEEMAFDPLFGSIGRVRDQ